MNDITEVDRLNAEIADLKRTIEWYQGRTGIMMGAAAGAALAAVPASEPVAQDAAGIRFRFFKHLSTAERMKVFGVFLNLSEEVSAEVTNHSRESRLLSAVLKSVAAPVSGMPDLAGLICALRTPSVLIANSESYIEGFAKARQMAADLATLPAAPAPTRANAGPSPGDMPMDRFIAALPLPQYPVAAPAPTEQAGELPPLPTHSLASMLEEYASNPHYTWTEYAKAMKEASDALHAITQWTEARATQATATVPSAK